MLVCFCFFIIAGKKSLIAILFLSSRESYRHAYESEELDYVILWV